MTTQPGGTRPVGAEPTAVLPTVPTTVPPPVRSAAPSRVRPGGAPSAADRSGAPPAPRRPERRPRPGRRPRPEGTARPDRRHRAAPLAWLPWALLAALLGLLALVLLAGALADTSADTERPEAAAPGRASSPGTLVVGETDLLSGPEALGRLASLDGQRAAGRGLRVESVVADEGFWVGSSAQQRVFVHLTPQARESAGESAFRVEAGQQVDLTGTVTATGPDDPARLGVTRAEGAEQLTAQRAYVRASQVRLSPSS